MQNKEKLKRYGVIVYPDPDDVVHGYVKKVDLGDIRPSFLSKLLESPFYDIIRTYRLKSYFTGIDDHVVMLCKDLFCQVDLLNDVGSWFYSELSYAILGPVIFLGESFIQHDLVGFTEDEADSVIKQISNLMEVRLI